MGKTVNVPSGKYVLSSARVKVERGFVHLLGTEQPSSIEILKPEAVRDGYKIHWITEKGEQTEGILIPIN